MRRRVPRRETKRVSWRGGLRLRRSITGNLKRAARLLDIVERRRSASCDLHLLVSFARDQDNIPGAGLVNRQCDGLMAVRLQRVARAGALQSGKRVVDDDERIFTAGIIAGQDHEVAAAAGGLAHQRTLAAVAIAAAS